MDYNYNLYNKLVFRKHSRLTVLFNITCTHRRCFRNMVNRLNRSSHRAARSTTRRFNY